jgi:DNA repair protein RadC
VHLTRQMKEVGRTMNIPVLDHIIIAGEHYTSLADKKLL